MVNPFYLLMHMKDRHEVEGKKKIAFDSKLKSQYTIED